MTEDERDQLDEAIYQYERRKQMLISEAISCWLPRSVRFRDIDQEIEFLKCVFSPDNPALVSFLSTAIIANRHNYNEGDGQNCIISTLRLASNHISNYSNTFINAMAFELAKA